MYAYMPLQRSTSAKTIVAGANINCRAFKPSVMSGLNKVAHSVLTMEIDKLLLCSYSHQNNKEDLIIKMCSLLLFSVGQSL